jgi:hypothetical protein
MASIEKKIIDIARDVRTIYDEIPERGDIFDQDMRRSPSMQKTAMAQYAKIFLNIFAAWKKISDKERKSLIKRYNNFYFNAQFILDKNQMDELPSVEGIINKLAKSEAESLFEKPKDEGGADDTRAAA